MVNRMDISYESYRIFYYAAKYQSFTGAAGALGGSQPNITRSVRNLEAALGCRLFRRSNQGVRLTPEGERLYAHVSLAVEHLQAGEAEIAADQSLQSGVVTIASSEIALRCGLLPVLSAYRGRYPGVRIRVSNYSVPQAIEALRSGLADLAAVTAPPSLPKTLRRKELMRIQEVPVAGMAFAFLRGNVMTLEALARYPLVGLGPHTATFSFYSRLFSERGAAFQPDIEAATADQILPLVRSGLGIGFVPEAFARDDILAGNVLALSLEPPVPKRPVYLLKREKQPLSVAARELERMLLAAGAER